MSSQLNALLDNGHERAPLKSGSNTVGGGGEEESEIYIRPDGKKVRRVKKTVVRTKSAEGLTGFLNAAVAAAPPPPVKKSAAASLPGTTTASNAASSKSYTEGEVYIRADGKKVRRVKKAEPKAEPGSAAAATMSPLAAVLSADNDGFKKSGAATVAGDRIAAPLIAAKKADDEEGEIYIRADGKKVRRVKKTVVKQVTLPEEQDSKPSALSKMMDDGAASKVGRSGAATVTGAPMKPPPLSSASAAGVGEIYIRPDGKKVRRVLKKPTEPEPAAAATTQPQLAAMLDSNPVSQPGKSGSATVAVSAPSKAQSFSEGEIYIRPDGKKVRRIKKSPGPADAAATLSATDKERTLSKMLDQPAAVVPNSSGAATISGDKNMVVKTVEEGEIYINKDGKKVRRVRKVVSRAPDGAAPSTSLSGVLGSGAAQPTATGAATVSGPAEGEVYIRADGKKVRRVKKSTVPDKQDTASTAEKTTTKTIAIAPAAKTTTKSIAISKPKSGLKSEDNSVVSTTKKLKKKDDASITSTTKKLKKKDDASITSATKKLGKKKDDASITSVSKKSKKKDDASVTSVSKSKSKSDGLSGFLDNVNKKHPKKVSGAVSVSGVPTIKPSKKSSKKSKKEEEKEDTGAIGKAFEGKLSGSKDDSVSVDAEGKKKKKSSKSSKTLDGFLDLKTVSRKGSSGAASVAGEYVAKKSSDAILDVKKHKEAEKDKASKKKKDKEKDKDKSKKDKSVSSAVGDLAGFFETKEKKSKKKKVRDSDVASVMESSDKPLATLAELKKASADLKDKKPKKKKEKAEKSTPAAEAAAPAKPTPLPAAPAAAADLTPTVIELTADEEAVASGYRKMRKMGLPDDAVQHKMSQDGVDPKIIASVLGLPWIQLTKEEEALAQYFRKMKRMGLPDDAIRHKMLQDGVPARIIAAVVGEASNQSASSPAPSQPPAPAPAPKPVVQEPAAPVSPPVVLTADEEAVASGFRRMKMMGLPDDAVRHKMTQDEVSAKIIAAVMGDPWSEPDAPKPAAVAPPAPPAAVTSAPVAPPTVSLSDEEEAIANEYRKMKKMGLPEDAVRHKMSQDGVDAKIISVVMGEALSKPASSPPATLPPPPPASVPAPPAPPSITLSASEDAIANDYRKMKKMGLPDDAIRHKMAQDGVHAKIIAAVLGDPWSEPVVSSSPAPAVAPSILLSDDEEATANQYRKLKKLGMPDDAVRHKMMQDGVHGKIIAAIFGEPWTETVAAPASAPAPTPAVAPSIALSAEEEGVASSYRKLKKMGMPDDAVRHKMTQDQISAKIIAAVMGDAWTEPKTTVAPSSDSRPSVQLTDEEEAIAQPYRKMKKMGMPDDAVRHKLTQDGVHAKIVAAVLGDAWTEPSTPLPAVVAPSLNAFSEEEQEQITRYKKMAKMGLPEDVVRQKMAMEGADSKIVNAVFSEAQPIGQTQPTVEQKPTVPMVAASPAEAVAYVVVVDEIPKADPGQSNRPQYQRSASLDKIDPNQKFAVAVDQSADPAASNGNTETKYMTLDDIARLSGESKESLEKMVASKRQNPEDEPRFKLHLLEKKQTDNLYAVQVNRTDMVPQGPPQAIPQSMPPPSGLPNPVDVNPALRNADPNSLKVVQPGQEVVNSKLADAARALEALGADDLKALLLKIQAGDMGDLLTKLQEAEKKRKKLEKQLAENGIRIAEDIDYMEAKNKVDQIARRMNEIGGSDVTHPDKEEQNRLREEYFKLEQEMEKYNTALTLTDEYQAEQQRLEQQWEDDNAPFNEEALRKIRRNMPVNIRNMSESELTNTPSPNGKFLPKATAMKFKRTNVLQLLRMNPDDIGRMHPASLESMRVTGLTVTERRALYAHLKPVGPIWEKNKSEKMTERKWTWYQMMKNNFKESLAPYLRHVAEYGPPGNHVGCPMIGKQCLIKADKMIDYDTDYGWTPDAEYESTSVTKSDADNPGDKALAEAREMAREKKANERADILKKHYNGKLLQVSKANGSCESMDESMDKMEFATMRWMEFIIEKGENEVEADKKKEVANFTESLNELKLAVLDYCQRSGMQMSGKKKAGGDSPDIRSAVECGLAEEVYETSQEFFTFINNRVKEIDIKDTRLEKTVELLQNLLGELHGRNLATLEKLGLKRPDRSRKLRKNEEMRKEAEEKMKPKEEEAPPEEVARPGPPMGMPRGGGRGDLLSALGRGRGRGGDDGGGRGGLLDALKGGRGRGRGGGGDGGGGRGGLLDAIAGRGKGKGGGGDGGGGDGGRGGLLAAIAGRGKGGPKPGGDGGGRGGLLAAIAARGGGGGD